MLRVGMLVACLFSALAWGASIENDGAPLTRALEWLLSPISGATDHDPSSGTYLHGRLMVLAWGFLVPVGILLSRFYKVTPGQDWPRVLNNPFWFNSHRAFAYGAGVLMLAAVVVIVLEDPRPPWRSFHAGIGWCVVIAGWLQLLSSHLRGAMGGPTQPGTPVPLRNWQWSQVPRAADGSGPRIDWPGDHYNMLRTRVVFEVLHKVCGYGLLAVSALTLVTGLLAADALNWMWVALLLWWLVCAAVFIVLQHQGQAIDCYQAIWGIDEALPGNRMKPIGWWGIRRYSSANVAAAPYPRRARGG